MLHALNLLVLHCSANQVTSKMRGKDIADYHTRPVAKGGRGWSVPGYSKVFTTDGHVDDIVKCNEDQWVQSNEVTNGAAGFNGNSRHWCYIGGIDKAGNPEDTRTVLQVENMKMAVLEFVRLHPDIKVCGHNQINPGKACPSFDVPKWLRQIGVPAKNIL